MEFLILFVVMAFGFYLGWKFREVYATAQIRRLMERAEEQAEKEELPEDRIPVNIEMHNNHYYVYHRDNNQFLGQGANLEEVEDVLMERFPGKKFACSEKMLREVGFLS